MRVPQYFNISSKFNLFENLCIVFQIYAQSDVRCKVYNSSCHKSSCLCNYTQTQIKSTFCCFKVLVIGFLFYIASINNDDLKIFHPGQRHLTRNRYICIKTGPVNFVTLAIAHMCLHCFSPYFYLHSCEFYETNILNFLTKI